MIGLVRLFREYNAKVNWAVFCFIFCFTIGAWLDINGLWCELPIMVHQLPEKWRLGSILSAATQIAQVGPLIFIFGKWKFPRQFTYVRAIYVILCIGATSCLLLAFFWNKTIILFNKDTCEDANECGTSIGLIVLNFSLALLDGTSSVTFLPYIGGNFIKEYIIPNYIGESLAALIPSILSLAQGLGQDLGCHNVTRFNGTTNYTVEEPIQVIPNYSVQVYFILMFLLLCISTTAFTMLNYSPIAKRARKTDSISSKAANKVAIIAKKTNDSFDSKDETLPDSTLNDSKSPILATNSNINASIRSEENAGLVKFLTDKNGTNDKWEKIVLNFYIFMVSFICYGVLPGLQSYSTLPYGNAVFNYAVNLSFVFLPVAIVLSIWSYYVTILQISIEFLIAVGFSTYILILSIQSPCPLLVGTNFGSFLSILSWILSQGMFMRVRCLVAARLERFGQKTLLILGTLTMIGQIFGGLLIFIVVNTYELLKSKPDCVFDFSYCK